MIVIYVGDVYEYLATLAKSQEANAKLLTSENYKDLSAGTYYTSVADMQQNSNFCRALLQADKIVYAPPPGNKWSGGKGMQSTTENLLNIFSYRSCIENFWPSEPVLDIANMLALADQRKSQTSQIWIAGCSISHGVGVNDNQRYGELLSKMCNLPVSFLTKSGSSLIWAADQILRSDIRKNDTVVWGMTSQGRLPFYHQGNLLHLTSVSFERDSNLHNYFDITTLANDDTLYRSLTSVFQVINYCEKLQAKLILASMLDTEIIQYLRDYKDLINFCHIWGDDPSDRFLDLGTDDCHPGPLSHKFYADEIYKTIRNQGQP